MNPVVRWFHQLGSPPYFDRFAKRWTPWAYGLAILVMAYGLYGALFMVPADYQQGDSFRILYIHVPSAWMSMAIFALMAIYAAIALVWRIKLCEILAMACAPIGAAFTLVTLATGSIWGKPMWGTWWDWDPRLTTELILLFLYLGVIGLYNAIDDRQQARGACGGAAVIDGVVQADHAEIQEQQDQFRGQARVPVPPRAPHRLAPDRTGQQGDQGEGGADRRAGHRQDFAQLDAPDQCDGGVDRHQPEHGHAHPCAGHVYVEDAEAVALLVVGRHLEQGAVQAPGHHQQAQSIAPRRPARGEAVEVGGRTEFVEPAQDRIHRFSARSRA